MRDRDPKRFRSLDVNDQLELRRLLYRQIARLCALQYPVDETSDLSVRGDERWSIGQKPAVAPNRNCQELAMAEEVRVELTEDVLDALLRV